MEILELTLLAYDSCPTIKHILASSSSPDEQLDGRSLSSHEMYALFYFPPLLLFFS